MHAESIACCGDRDVIVKQKLTGWISIKNPPVRKGLYQLRDGFGESIGYQYWNGRKWGYWGSTPESAMAGKNGCAYMLDDECWRGLAVSASVRREL